MCSCNKQWQPLVHSQNKYIWMSDIKLTMCVVPVCMPSPVDKCTLHTKLSCVEYQPLVTKSQNNSNTYGRFFSHILLDRNKELDMFF